jgi:hypothetical protein
LQFLPIIFWQAAGLFALAVLQVTVPPTAFSGLPLVAASSRAVTATCFAGLPLQSLPEQGRCKKIFICLQHFPPTLSQTVRMLNFKNK